MNKSNHISEDKQNRSLKQTKEDKTASEPAAENPISQLQQQVGNQAVQRLIQRSGDGPAELDDETAGRINSARGSGQTLDDSVQKNMGDAMGTDFSDVRVHTGKEANELNQDVGAEACTTGRDIFFKDGNYRPNTSSGDELLAHELTHVVQQGEGRVSGGSGMTVNAPGDSFEQEADRVASAVTGPAAGAGVQRLEEGAVQRQDIPEEEEVQMQETPEEEEIQMQEEEEEALQMQEEEEEMMQPKRS